MKDLSLVSGEAIQLHYYLQARPRLMVGFLVFIIGAQLEIISVRYVGILDTGTGHYCFLAKREIGLGIKSEL